MSVQHYRLMSSRQQRRYVKQTRKRTRRAILKRDTIGEGHRVFLAAGLARRTSRFTREFCRLYPAAKAFHAKQR